MALFLGAVAALVQGLQFLHLPPDEALVRFLIVVPIFAVLGFVLGAIFSLLRAALRSVMSTPAAGGPPPVPVAQAPAPSSVVPSVAPAAGGSTDRIARKLDDIEALYRSGRISEQERALTRSAVLASLSRDEGAATTRTPATCQPTPFAQRQGNIFVKLVGSREEWRAWEAAGGLKQVRLGVAVLVVAIVVGLVMGLSK